VSRGNLPLALRVAQGYLALGRVTGDPRYAGYAEAALGPWWRLDQAPQEVLVVRATLRQRAHQFDAALADLAAVLKANPRNAQARLTRATILQVQGAYEGAREECRALQDLTLELVWAACLASVNAATGKLRESYWQLRAVLGRHANAPPGVKNWVLTSLAEMAVRAGMTQEAEGHFRAALALNAADNYLLGAYADFQLDSDRASEVVGLLRDQTRADPLLLRQPPARRPCAPAGGGPFHIALADCSCCGTKTGAGKLADTERTGGCPHPAGGGPRGG